MKFFLNFLLAFCGCIFVSCAKSHETKMQSYNITENNGNVVTLNFHLCLHYCRNIGW